MKNMKEETKSKHARPKLRISKTLFRSLVIVLGIAIILIFFVWYVEYRPQYIEFPFDPPSDSWSYVEYSVGHTSQAHYWIVRYNDNCERDCNEWLDYLDLNLKQLEGNWGLGEFGGPVSYICAGHLNKSINDENIRIVSYKDNDSYFPYSLLCVAMESTSDRKHTFLSVATVRPSFASSIRLTF